MSQVKLTLRPPPNVDFVHGYPGIPPGAPDRPQASVKGAIEVRVGPQGVKAKWVRIELRKVETLPGGGMMNTFYDFVGPSPVNLWSSSDEYSLLRTQDFPFSIRIPESIPPSIALENRAGIQYELVASVCTKGKKGWLRKRKSIVVSTQAPVIIDKHELHSTWPVYCQPEARHLTQEGVTLTVNRNQTCYGPGDRISLKATLKSDSLHTVILRGFEITLKESTIFRAGLYISGKKSAPQARVAIITESKLPVNATLYGGTQHNAELACNISPNHTTTTLNAARHIDITYALSVKALMGTGMHLIMDLPVIISNWQRGVSFEAIRRIGPAPSLSLLPPNGHAAPAQSPVSRIDPPPIRPIAATLPPTRLHHRSDAEYQPGLGRNFSATTHNTLLTQNPGYQGGPTPKVDEMGYGVGAGSDVKPNHSYTNSVASSHLGDEPVPRTVSTTGGTSRRPNSATANGATNRFTITNADIPEENNPSRSGSGADAGGSSARGPWFTAEEEKRLLYESAKAKVEKVQGSVVRANTPPSMTLPDLSPTLEQARPAPHNTPWPTAEEEKLKLYNEAQAAVKKTQGLDSYSPPSSLHGKTDSDVVLTADSNRTASSSNVPPAISTNELSPGAILYSRAMSAKSGGAGAKKVTSPPKTSPSPKIPQYLTAEQEKAALRRYEEAKLAVDRTQNAGYIYDETSPLTTGLLAPMAYESLYPHTTPSASSSAPVPNDLPPPFDMLSSPVPASHLSEKEQLRRAYEAQDALAQQNNTSYTSPPPFSSGSFSSGFSEKEVLRRKFEAQDAEAGAGPPKPPPRVPSAGRMQRPTPVPPIVSGRVLTAAEEKALLKAQYEAEDAGVILHVNGVNGNQPSNSFRFSPLESQTPPPDPAPPPLMPRPPAEYIQETQEEDARVSRFVMNGVLPPVDGEDIPVNRTAPLEMQLPLLSTGRQTGWTEHPVPPPPLPPKPGGE